MAKVNFTGSQETKCRVCGDTNEVYTASTDFMCRVCYSALRKEKALEKFYNKLLSGLITYITAIAVTSIVLWPSIDNVVIGVAIVSAIALLILIREIILTRRLL